MTHHANGITMDDAQEPTGTFHSSTRDAVDSAEVRTRTLDELLIASDYEFLGRYVTNELRKLIAKRQGHQRRERDPETPTARERIQRRA